MAASEYHDGECDPTVDEADDFDFNYDANELDWAMQGSDTDRQTIIDILSRRSMVQRLEIAEKFKTMFDEDLVDKLKSELSGNFKKATIALMTPLPEYYARELHDAIFGTPWSGTDDDAITEILTSLSSYGIKTVSAVYKDLYHSELEDDLKDESNGYFKRLLVSLSFASRNENNDVDDEEAKADAEMLLDAGEDQWGTEESVLNEILITKSYQQLRRIFQHYEEIAGHTLDEEIKREFLDPLEEEYVALVKCGRYKTVYFAKRLDMALSGKDTNEDATLIRIIVARSEIDLGDIKKTYEQIYGKSLTSAIDDDEPGDYRTLLSALVGR